MAGGKRSLPLINASLKVEHQNTGRTQKKETERSRGSDGRKK